jgi:outer membrane immunogenic protein
MKRFVMSSLAFVFAASAAQGADLPARYKGPPVPPAQAFAFEGFYVGGQAGFAGTGDRLREIYVPSNVTFATRTLEGGSFIGGAHAGYDWHSGPIVFGLVGDVDGARAVSSATTFYGLNVRNAVGVQGSLRGRLGYAFDHLLVYGTGGLFVGSVGRDYGFGLGYYAHTHRIVVSPTVGVGAEYAFDDHWRANVEYRASGIARSREYAPIALPVAKLRHDAAEGELKLGVSYRFGL